MTAALARQYVEQFRMRASLAPGRAPDTLSWEGGLHEGHLVVGSVIHGNEVGSLPAILKIIDGLMSGSLRYGGKVTFFLGNPAALEKDKRFLESDLNRVFLPRTSTPPTYEEARAQQLMPLLKEATLFFDFHQTIQPAEEPFYIFAYHRPSYLWARIAQQARVLVTRPMSASFSANQCCADEFARSQGVPAITLELGQKGFSEDSTARTEKAVLAVLAGLDRRAREGVPLEALAQDQPDFEFFETTHKEPFASGRSFLKPGLRNFTRVRKGDILGDSEGLPMAASRDGIILFPKYPDRDEYGVALEPRPGEIYMLAEKLERHPEELWAQPRAPELDR